MPFSDSQGKDVIAKYVREIDPAYVLDIGPGAGVYSDIVRMRTNRLRHVEIDAIEAWGPYIEKFNLSEKYDRIIVGDVRYIAPKHMSHYNLVIIGDVVEHLHKWDARDILVKLAQHNDNLIISFPVLHLDQGSYEGNFFETHLDHWSYDEMSEFWRSLRPSYRVVDSGHGDVLAWFWVQRVD